MQTYVVELIKMREDYEDILGKWSIDADSAAESLKVVAPDDWPVTERDQDFAEAVNPQDHAWIHVPANERYRAEEEESYHDGII